MSFGEITTRPVTRVGSEIPRRETAARTDAEIEREIHDEVLSRAFQWCSPGHVEVDVHHGAVVLAGAVESEDIARMLVAAAERVPGVLSARSELKLCEADDVALEGGAER